MIMRIVSGFRGFFLWVSWWACVAASLTACGGGGSSTTTSTSTTTTSTSTAVVTATSTAPVTVAAWAVSGVAATGAPLLGASVRVVDANGARLMLLDAAGNTVDRYRTSTADGSFRFQLAVTAMPSLPLLVQAAGVDGAGMPVVLHSMLNTSTLPLITNINPATDAVVAQLLGGAPRTVFATATSAWPSLTLLNSTTAVATASDHIKTIIAANLTDAKITSSKTLDFFQDTTFTAGKTGFDAALESLKIQIVKDNSGRDQLQISNKLLAPGVVEVKLDLATALAELIKGSAGTVGKSISSTLKTSTSPKTSLTNLATLDSLGVAVNNLIAQGATAAAFLASPMLASHKSQNGRARADLAELLGNYATLNNQLGRWQVTGCVDNPVPTTGCTRLGVSALVSDRSGQVVDVVADTVGYKTSTVPNWVFVGNDRSSDVRVIPVAVASLSLDGKVQTGVAAPTNGIQVLARAMNYASSAAPSMQAVQSAVIQVPSGYSVLYRYCGAAELCLAPNAAQNPVATGELKDSLVQKPAPGWVGSLDATRGAKYVASVSLVGTVTETFSPYLMADVPIDLSAALFPKPDQPLSAANVSAGFTLTWRNWADQNPDMRLLSVRLITQPASGVQVQDFPVLSPYATTMTLAAAPDAATAFQFWLVAMDSFGRRFYSQFSTP